MPISPQELTDKRLETTINKLCDIIDKKLQESEDMPFRFNFLPNTSPQAQTSIVEIYRNAGWSAELGTKDHEDYWRETYLVLSNPISGAQSNLEVVQLDDEVSQTDKRAHNESIIEASFTSERGRDNIATSMAEPIKTSLQYQSFARKFLMADELPLNTPPRYENATPKAVYYASDGTVKQYDCDKSDDFYVIKAEAELKHTEAQARRFYTLERIQVKLKDKIQNQELDILVQLLQRAATFDQTIYTYGETICRAILDSMGEIESEELMGAKVLMHPRTYRRAMSDKNFKTDCVASTLRDVLMVGLHGHIHSMDVHLSCRLPENEVFVMPPAQFLGAWSVKEDVKVTKTDTSDSCVFEATEHVLPVIVNPEYVRKIVVRW